MIKKVLISLTLSTLLFADYYSAMDSSLVDDKVLLFEGGVKLEKLDTRVSISSSVDMKDFQDDGVAHHYEDTLFSYRKNKKEELVHYKTYNLNYIFQNNISAKKFVLKSSKYIYIVVVKKSKTSLDILGEQRDVICSEFTILQAYNKELNEIKLKENKLLTKYVDSKGNLVAISLLNSGKKMLKRVVDESLKRFLDEKKQRVVSVKKFDFKEENLYLSYISQKLNLSQRLNITYGERKGYIKTVLKSPLSLFDPQNKSSLVEQNIGFLKEYKGDLYEVKKVQIVDAKIDVSWKNSPKKSIVVINYTTDGIQDRSVLSKSKTQQFYGIEGVFYLLNWMQKNAIESKVFIFINGSIPFDVTMKKIASSKYAMQKSSQTIYEFELDKDGFVEVIQYPDFNLRLELESKDTETTLVNKKFLKDFQEENNIKLIKGEMK